MLNYASYINLKNALGEITKLTTALKQNSGSYAAAVAELFVKLQKIADESRLYISSDVALAIQKLCSFDGKSVQDAGRRRSPRKERDDYALNCLAELHGKIKEYLEKYNTTYEECESVCRQIAAQITVHNPSALRASTDVAADIMAIASKQDALKPYYAHIIGALGKFNAKAVFDTVLPQMGI